jgi:hypothetical protein
VDALVGEQCDSIFYQDEDLHGILSASCKRSRMEEYLEAIMFKTRKLDARGVMGWSLCRSDGAAGLSVHWEGSFSRLMRVDID